MPLGNPAPATGDGPNHAVCPSVSSPGRGSTRAIRRPPAQQRTAENGARRGQPTGVPTKPHRLLAGPAGRAYESAANRAAIGGLGSSQTRGASRVCQPTKHDGGGWSGHHPPPTVIKVPVGLRASICGTSRIWQGQSAPDPREFRPEHFARGRVVAYNRGAGRSDGRTCSGEGLAGAGRAPTPTTRLVHRVGLPRSRSARSRVLRKRLR